MKSELIYLASPYSHKEHHIMFARFLLVSKVAAKLIESGNYVYSPISHSHPIAEVSNGKLPRGWDFWEGYDRRMLSCCDKIIVLCLPGWEESQGVQAEIKIGKEMKLPIEYLNYNLDPKIEDIVAVAMQTESFVYGTTENKLIIDNSHNIETISTNQKIRSNVINIYAR